MAAVFLTTELLENILKILPMKDLLLAQRVSRYWQSVITESVSLQQMLFFKPKQADFCWLFDEAGKLKWPQRVDRDYELPGDSEHLTLLKHAEMNSMIFEVGANDNIWDSAPRQGGTNVMAKPKSRLKRPAAKYPEASWRKMLISQPPVKTCEWYSYDMFFTNSDGEESSDGQGIGMFDGDLDGDKDITCLDLFEPSKGAFAKSLYSNFYNMGTVYPDEDGLVQILAEQGVLQGEVPKKDAA